MNGPTTYGHHRDHRDDGCVVQLGLIAGLLAGVAWAVRGLIRMVRS